MPPESDDGRTRLTPLHQPTLLERLENLEQVVFEGEDLATAVERLGMNASALGEALLTVDKNQQMLTRLGKQLQDVENRSATKVDVDQRVRATQAELERYRTHVVARAYTAAVIVLALFFAIGLAVANDVADRSRNQYQQCVAGLRQRNAVVEYLNDVQRYGTVATLRESAGRVVEALPAFTCDKKAF